MGLRLVKQTSEWRKSTNVRQMVEMNKKAVEFTEVIDKVLRIENVPYYFGKYEDIRSLMVEANDRALESSQHSVFTFEMKRTKGETK